MHFRKGVTITIENLGVILVTATVTEMSNAAHNWPSIKSTSYLELFKKLIRRHIIAGPVIFLLFFIVPKTMGWFGIFIDLAFIIAGIGWSVRTVKAARHQKRYIKELAPKYPCKYTRIWLDPQMDQRLGGTAIHYMFICPQTKVITFPESKYKNRRKYYLLNLKFKPKYGPNYERLTYVGKPFTRKSLFRSPKTRGKSFTEIPTIATATLESIKTSKKIRIRLHDEISNRIAKLENDIYSSNVKTV